MWNLFNSWKNTKLLAVAFKASEKANQWKWVQPPRCPLQKHKKRPLKKDNPNKPTENDRDG